MIKQNPGENLTSIPLFSPPARQNNPDSNTGQIKLAFSWIPQRKHDPTGLSSFYQQLPLALRITGGTSSMSEPTEHFSKSGASPGSHRKPFPWSRRRGQSEVHRKKEKAASHHSLRWGRDRKYCFGNGTPQPAKSQNNSHNVTSNQKNKQQPVKPVFELNLFTESSNFPQSNFPQNISMVSQAFLPIASSSMPNIPTTSPRFTTDFAFDWWASHLTCQKKIISFFLQLPWS